MGMGRLGEVRQAALGSAGIDTAAHGLAEQAALGAARQAWVERGGAGYACL